MSNQRVNMAYYGKTPWHGLGHVLTEEDTKDMETVAKIAGLDWSVLETKVNYEVNDQNIHMPDVKALVRSDTMAPLSIVSRDLYKTVQPKKIIEFYKHFIESHGFTMETAGSLSGGKKIWALAKINESSFVSKNDKINPYLLLATSYDKTMSTRWMFTSVRVVCNNTLQVAYYDNNFKSELQGSVPHSTDFDENKLILDVESLMKYWNGFMDQNRELSKRIVSREETVQFFLDLLYPNKDKDELGTRSKNNIINMVEVFKNGVGQQEAGNTAWGLVNAVTRYVDHEKGRSRDTALNSAWFGVGSNLKLEAYKQAIKLVA